MAEENGGKKLKIVLEIDLEKQVESVNAAFQTAQNLFAGSENLSDAEYKVLFDVFEKLYTEATRNNISRGVKNKLKVDLSKYSAEERNKKHDSEAKLKDPLRKKEEKQTRRKQDALSKLSSIIPGFTPEMLMAHHCFVHKKPKAECGCK
jgi:hypothetical protein